MEDDEDTEAGIHPRVSGVGGQAGVRVGDLFGTAYYLLRSCLYFNAKLAQRFFALSPKCGEMPDGRNGHVE